MHQVPVTVWLASIGLSEYCHLFKGYTNVGSLLALTERDLKNLGLINSAHRARLYSTLSLYKDKTSSSTRLSEDPYTKQVSKSRPQSVLLESNWDSLLTNTWFHGSISYQQAESLLRKNGDFLIRESTSKPGSFVLSCRWRNELLHIVVNSNFSNPARPEYGFDGDVYPTIASLVTSYVGERKPVTVSTGAIVSSPVHRTTPLVTSRTKGSDLIPSKPTLCKSFTTSIINTQGPRSPLSPPASPAQTAMTTKGSIFSNNQPLRANGRVYSVPHLANSTAMDTRGKLNGSGVSDSLKEQIYKLAGSQPNLLETVEEQGSGDSEKAPPKPSRVPTIKRKDGRPVVQVRNKELYEDDGRDYSDIDQVLRTPPTIKVTEDDEASSVDSKSTKSSKKPKSTSNLSRHRPSPASSISPRNNNRGKFERQESVTYDNPSSIPLNFFVPLPSVPISVLHLDTISTSLLPPDNKALFPDSLAKIKALLVEKNYRTLAQHISLVDYEMLRITSTKNMGAGITTGPEIVTLPQGEHFRSAVIERHTSLTYFVAVTIVMMNVTSERAFMLKQWILIAAELFRNHGNLMSFYAILDGLLHPTVERLTNTWSTLAQMDAQVYTIFKQKMASVHKALGTCTSGLPVQNVSIPLLLPVCQMLEREDSSKRLSWETGSVNYDLDTLLAHLDTARLISDQTASYRLKAHTVIRETMREDVLCDLFRVEMHMKLLFGCYGCRAPRELRWEKFQHILAILSNKIEMHDLGTEL